ncbi:MAG: ribosome assembly cofactor RimP [Flavobacteriales bacterium]|nr:ribosome assembly cofactor RimP [Flavobacteriales bacterium]MCB9364748.1 ribosome assembly cofactor RimP [Flavobacteriales bacterium]
MITKEQILSLIDEKLKDEEFFLVDLEILPGNIINIELDGYEGITIKDCVDFSRQIEHNLDREEEDFELHVSSPGLDKPFRVFQQYEKNIGREVKVVPNEGQVVKGTLIEVDAEKITLEHSFKQKIEGKKKKEKITKQEIVPFTNIKETTIIISFK